MTEAAIAITNPLLVRRFIAKGESTDDETYIALTDLAAKHGCLVMTIEAALERCSANELVAMLEALPNPEVRKE